MAFKYTSLENLPKIEVPYEELGQIMQGWQQQKDITELKLEENINFAEEFSADSELAKEIVNYKTEISNNLANVAKDGNAESYMRDLNSAAKNLALLESENGALKKLGQRATQWDAIKTTMKDMYSDDPVKAAMYEGRVKNQIESSGPIYDVASGLVKDIDFDTEKLTRHYTNKEVQDSIVTIMKSKALEILSSKDLSELQMRQLNEVQTIVELKNVIHGKNFKKIYNASKKAIDPGIILSMEDSARARLTMGNEESMEASRQIYEGSYTEEDGKIVFDINNPNHPTNKMIEGFSKLEEESKLDQQNTVVTKPTEKKPDVTNVNVTTGAVKETQTKELTRKEKGIWGTKAAKTSEVINKASNNEKITSKDLLSTEYINKDNLYFDASSDENIKKMIFTESAENEKAKDYITKFLSPKYRNSAGHINVKKFVNDEFGDYPEEVKQSLIKKFGKHSISGVQDVNSFMSLIGNDLGPYSLFNINNTEGVIDINGLKEFDENADSQNNIYTDSNGEPTKILPEDSEGNIRAHNGGIEHMITDENFRGQIIKYHEDLSKEFDDVDFLMGLSVGFTKESAKEFIESDETSEKYQELKEGQLNKLVTVQMLAEEKNYRKITSNLDQEYIFGVNIHDKSSGGMVKSMDSKGFNDLRMTYGVPQVNVKYDPEDGSYAVTDINIDDTQNLIVIPKDSDAYGLKAGVYTRARLNEALGEANIFDRFGSVFNGKKDFFNKGNEHNEELLKAMYYKGMITKDNLKVASGNDALAKMVATKLNEGASAELLYFDPGVPEQAGDSRRSKARLPKLPMMILSGATLVNGSNSIADFSTAGLDNSNSAYSKVDLAPKSAEAESLQIAINDQISIAQSNLAQIEAMLNDKETTDSERTDLQKQQQFLQEALAQDQNDLKAVINGQVQIRKRTTITPQLQRLEEEYAASTVLYNDFQLMKEEIENNPNFYTDNEIDEAKFNESFADVKSRYSSAKQAKEGFKGNRLEIGDPNNINFTYEIRYGDDDWNDVTGNEYDKLLSVSHEISKRRKLAGAVQSYRYHRNFIELSEAGTAKK